MKHKTIKEQIFDLENKINKVKDNGFEKIVKIIIKVLNNYQKNKESFPKVLPKKIEDSFYKILEDVFNTTSTGIKDIYFEVTDFSIKNIADLTYSLDGKTLEDRLKEYWNEARKYLNQGWEIEKVKNYLINNYDRILTTETKVIENKVKQHKRPLQAFMLIIESGGCPECQGGEYSIDEDIEWPPFHPDCQCCAYYEITDNKDDIDDLELEE